MSVCQSASAGAVSWNSVKPHPHGGGVAHMHNMPSEGDACSGPIQQVLQMLKCDMQGVHIR